MATVPTVALNDGARMPAIGFGTYPLRGDEGAAVVAGALEAGYRLIDTAVNYGNEDAVGRAVAESAVPRDEVTVATKLPGRDHGYQETLRSFEASIALLGRIDLYLIHWPNPSRDRYLESWRAMIELRRQGRVRSIGVSNFTTDMLARLGRETGVLPAVNQIELHPYFPQDEARAYHREHGIQTEAWSPLGKRAPVLKEPVIEEVAAAHGVTPAQAVLRWHVQLGSVPIPKSATPSRQRENLEVFGFELEDAEMAAITALGRPDGRLFDGDPDTHEEM